VGVLVAAACAGAVTPTRAGDLVIALGTFDVSDDTYRALEAGLQYRVSGRWWLLQPILGALATSAGGLYLYAGLGVAVPLGASLLLSASFAPGYYDRGRGKDLGDPLEFRTTLGLAWRLGGGRTLGLEVDHVSNQNLGTTNPGQGSLLLTLSVPLR
jgi:hypothetical protein